ncbi:unnamed protein product [Oppiella nova]|uniref:Uncharacterized protein n=1 Tax=Oppiella nova TaxID=334625 RepID=A0A7R9QYF0_9ACAR|nr:unnamed protein product [Oppiella nova]CAG2179528.1 unnamed protein product [Oppiella nova]
MHIYVPQRYRSRNLTVNEHRLTTPFDIHSTLKHILEGKPNTTLKYGLSLLEEIPYNRSCDSIPILEHWCGCQTSQPIHDLHSVRPMAEFVVTKLNDLLHDKYSNVCLNLTFGETLSAFEQQMNDKVLRYLKSDNEDIMVSEVKHYLLTIRVHPSDGVFESTVHLNTTSHQMLIIGDISRINLYANQSHCVDSPWLKKYCFCKDLL